MLLIVKMDELNVRNNELSNELNMRNSEDVSLGDCREKHKWISDLVNWLQIPDFQGLVGAKTFDNHVVFPLYLYSAHYSDSNDIYMLYTIFI